MGIKVRQSVFIAVLVLLGAVGCSQATSEERSRLDLVQDRGKVVCATLSDTPGFGFLDESSTLAGFDIDLCRAVAVAALGDPEAVELRIITSAERGPSCSRER